VFDPRCFAALALMTVMTVTPALADPSGVWLEQDGGTIRIRHCGAAMCATIVSVNPPLDPATGKPRTDKNNVDASKRNRPLVGVPVLLSMMPDGPGRWSGRLYDPDRGQIFDGHLVEIDANAIRIEGCALGICGGENLSRVSK
jgi:uncharacterized protein (DUF2147 family)